MAFTARTETYARGSSLTTPFNFTINKATGVVDGDIMFMFLAIYLATPPTIDSVPAGWTQVATNTTTNSRWYLYYKIASSEGTNYTWSLTASCRYYAYNVAYSSGDFSVASISDITAISNTLYATAGTTVRAASMSVPAANSPLVYFAAIYNTTVRTFTKPTAPTTGWVEDGDEGNTTPDLSVTYGSMIWSGSGATGDMDVICSTSITTYKHAFAISLKPAPAPITADITETGTAAETEDSINSATGTIAESITGTDTQSNIFTGLSSQSEAGAGMDNNSAIATLLSGVIEALTGISTEQGGILSDAAISEDVTSIELQAVILTAVSSIVESSEVIESQSNILTGIVAISESVSIIDIENAISDILTSITELGIAEEIRNALITSSSAISETGSLTDQQTGVIITAVSVIEAINIISTTDAVNVLIAVIAETADTLDESEGNVLNLAEATETGYVIDTQDAVNILSASVSELCDATDSLSNVITGLSDSEETVSLSDIITGLAILNSAITEPISAVDLSEGSISGIIYPVSIIESSLLNDLSDAGSLITGQIVESVAAIDQVEFIEITEILILSSLMVTFINAVSIMDNSNEVQSSMGGSEEITSEMRNVLFIKSSI